MPGSGHPQVYIQVNTRNPGEPVSCKYCGLRYALEGHHWSHKWYSITSSIKKIQIYLFNYEFYQTSIQ